MLLAYGREKVPLTFLTELDWQEVSLPYLPPLENPAATLRDALRRPIGHQPLGKSVRAGERICIIVNDSTRVARSDVFLPILIDELTAAGVREEDIFIVFSNGSHRLMSQDEMTALVGTGVAERIAMYNHDCADEDNLVYRGETSRGVPLYLNKRVCEADLCILTGSIVYHFFAGFGGGRKALVPGVAGHRTIKANHSMMLDERAGLGMLKRNPVHEDLLEGAKLAGRSFLFNVVLSGDKEFLAVFAGDMERAHALGCAFVQKAYGIALQEKADLVIASCGGYPKDINLYQAQKTLENAAQAMKEGGQIILLAQCPEGVGSLKYEEWAFKYQNFAQLENAIRANFELGGHKAYAYGRIFQRGRVILVSDLPAPKARMLGFTPASSVEEAYGMVLERGKPRLTYVLPQGSLTVPVAP